MRKQTERTFDRLHCWFSNSLGEAFAVNAARCTTPVFRFLMGTNLRGWGVGGNHGAHIWQQIFAVEECRHLRLPRLRNECLLCMNHRRRPSQGSYIFGYLSVPLEYFYEEPALGPMSTKIRMIEFSIGNI